MSPRSAVHEVDQVRSLSGDGFVLEVRGPIPPTVPGQFYMLRTDSRWPRLLPVPFSLYDRDPSGARGAFLGKRIGPGTRALAECRPGERLHLTGPLGNGFPADLPEAWCVAGGVGLAPFLLLARLRAAAGATPPVVLFGGRDRDALFGLEPLEPIARVVTATEDGSHGHHGLVTDLLEEAVARGELRPGQAVLCCGPDPMMHAVAEICAVHDLACWLSLETYMACGYGVCNGCSVRVRPEAFENWPYSRACREGPVYRAADLLLD